jgi:hypothetical protein
MFAAYDHDPGACPPSGLNASTGDGVAAAPAVAPAEKSVIEESAPALQPAFQPAQLAATPRTIAGLSSAGTDAVDAEIREELAKTLAAIDAAMTSVPGEEGARIVRARDDFHALAKRIAREWSDA